MSGEMQRGTSRKRLAMSLLIILTFSGESACEQSAGKSEGQMKFERIRTQFIAALGDPAATSGSGAETWGLWQIPARWPVVSPPGRSRERRDCRKQDPLYDGAVRSESPVVVQLLLLRKIRIRSGSFFRASIGAPNSSEPLKLTTALAKPPDD